MRAKQIGLALDELDQMEEGFVMDLIIESGNDTYADEYQQLATQQDFDNF